MPDLLVTVDRYLSSLRAVLAPDNNADCDQINRIFEPQLSAGLSEEQRAINRRQFEKTEQIVRQFMSNEGPQLQRDLKEYANKCQNWVSKSLIKQQLIDAGLVVSRLMLAKWGQLMKWVPVKLGRKSLELVKSVRFRLKRREIDRERERALNYLASSLDCERVASLVRIVMLERVFNCAKVAKGLPSQMTQH